ncbi:alkaline phosphatase family protein [Paraburkholderia bannensis]|uniref:alkaline phosphatase family protein n=1 Tax=Paraburkholderia bannensis TaxID=765414 RepID=UPI002AB788F5|nr:alkaline phosphatase family protein [Paraburkholderia bannensis]
MKTRAMTLASRLAFSGIAASLAACGSSISDTAHLQISGVAGQGTAVVGVSVTVTDRTGAVTQSAVTDATGRFSVAVSGRAPFVLTVPITDADGTPAVLSSIIDPASGDGTQSLNVNLNPLTSLITQRTLGVALTGAPTASQIGAGNVSAASIGAAVTAVDSVLQPLFTAMNVPSALVADPIGSATYQVNSANTSNALDSLFDNTRFIVHNATVNVGNNNGAPTQNSATFQTLQLPLTGAMPAPLSSGPVASALAQSQSATATPIQHLVVIVGENQTFDGLFGAYAPPSGQTVKNLLSEGIINADGSPGPNFALAAQNQAAAPSAYTLNPTRTGAYSTLPSPENTGMLTLNNLPAYISSVAQGKTPSAAPTSYLYGAADADFPVTLKNGPFQITTSSASSSLVNYSQPVTALVGTAATNASFATLSTLYSSLGLVATTGDPVHRFFQMWQQTGGDNAKLDLFTWVASTAGQGGDTVENVPGGPQVSPTNPGQGGELMGFMNMSAGDAPYLKSLAQQYALSDNYHQAVMGGTGMNFFSIATGDLPWYSSNGAIATPPANQIENPNPLSGTTNFYTQDGYQGGSWVNCSDSTQPGVGAILGFLSSKRVASNCDAGKYYLVNNYNPGYDLSGNTQPIGANNYNYPPQSVPTIAEALAAKGLSWGWFTTARDTADVQAQATSLATSLTGSTTLASSLAGLLQQAEYNNIGDPLVGSQKVMTSSLKGNLQDLTAFLTAAKSGNLPAVSFVVPPNTFSGHPGFSSPAAYEQWLSQVVAAVTASKQWSNTAILVTTDEGGGHFDTGPIQPLDFFGDGPRIPMLVISPYARKASVDHTYNDHASILKFIERNWRLTALSSRSRDRLPNPSMQTTSYVPANGTPAIGDLMTMFAF